MMMMMMTITQIIDNNLFLRQLIAASYLLVKSRKSRRRQFVLWVLPFQIYVHSLINIHTCTYSKKKRKFRFTTCRAFHPHLIYFSAIWQAFVLSVCLLHQGWSWSIDDLQKSLFIIYSCTSGDILRITRITARERQKSFYISVPTLLNLSSPHASEHFSLLSEKFKSQQAYSGNGNLSVGN